MFKLHLDLVIVYDPPMENNGPGLRLTREIELPFPPYDGLHICGRQIDTVYGPEGFVLKEVKWDLDRKVFLGHVELISHDLPMEDIPADLKCHWALKTGHLGALPKPATHEGVCRRTFPGFHQETCDGESTASGSDSLHFDVV